MLQLLLSPHSGALYTHMHVYTMHCSPPRGPGHMYMCNYADATLSPHPGALDRLGNLFAPSNINAVVDWVRERWWAVLVAGVGLLVGFFLLILVVHLLLPRPEHVKQRAQRRKTLLRSHTQPGVYPDGQGHGRHEMRKRQ